MLNKIINIIKDTKKIAILPHINADGDALGSSIALALALRKMGKEVIVFVEEEIPKVYGFLYVNDLVKVYKGEISSFEAALSLDTGDLERLGERVEIFNGAKVTVNIDHHNTNSEFAVYNYIDQASSATGEIVFRILKMLETEIDKPIAENLYVAITTDTGGFRYSNTTSVTHSIVSELIKSGVKVNDISQKIFDTTTVQKVKLTGLAINSLELYENGKVAFITLTDKEMIAAGAKDEDCEGIVNIGRNIDSVEVAVMFRHKSNGEIKVNFRSKNFADVAQIASIYGGGGHKRAAGCVIAGRKIEDVKGLMLKDIKEELIKLR